LFENHRGRCFFVALENIGYNVIMPTESKNLGDLGEKAAADYLKNKGYGIIERNFENAVGRRLGEIDIIAMDNRENELVFVEVKTRELDKFRNTLPEENITYPKIRKLAKIAGAYLRLRGLEDANYRFDAISVWLDKNGRQAKIKHILSL